MKITHGAVAMLAALSLCGHAAAQDTAPQVAAPQDAAPQDAAPSPAPEATVASTTSEIAGAAPEGKGQVVFFRPKQFMGAAISFKVREGEAEVGKLSYGTYFVAPLEPGVHTFKVHSEAKDELTLEVEAGETYYVSTAMAMGVALYRPNMSPSDKAAFDAVGAKLKVSRLDPKSAG